MTEQEKYLRAKEKHPELFYICRRKGCGKEGKLRQIAQKKTKGNYCSRDCVDKDMKEELKARGLEFYNFKKEQEEAKKILDKAIEQTKKEEEEKKIPEGSIKSEWVHLGEQLLAGKKIKEITLNGKVYKFNPIQSEFISNLKDDFCLNAGGYGSGKSCALYVKLILFVKCFPGNRVLLGRKTLSDIDRSILPELFAMLPSSWYEHRIKDGLINFSNGSQVVLFGLDAMQSGGTADIKKAQQKLKSLNLGAYFIDQLEEVEYEVFEAANSRLRRMEVPVRQGNMTCNPANFWAYDYFVANPRPGFKLYQSSMYDNRDNLPEDYLRKQEAMGEDYVRRFVKGEWTTDILLKGSVFAKEHIAQLEKFIITPLRMHEGCEIYEESVPGVDYIMGVDPSEGIIDPSSISVVSSSGHKVAKWNGKIPITGLSDKVKVLHYMYNKCLIIPESNSAGAALIREIRDLKVYRRKQLEYKQDIETEKLGFRMSWDTKQQLISHFQVLLRNKSVKIFDRKTIEQMKTFLWNDDATQQGAGAARGFHDDDVMSTLLAYFEFSPQKVMQIEVARTRPVRRKSFQYM